MYAVLNKTTLAANINITQTSIDVTSTDNLPSIGVGQYLVVLVNDRFKTEIMHCTDITGTTLTVVRGQKDDKVYNFTSGAYVQFSIDPDGFEIEAGSGDGLELFEVMALTSLRI